jgi:TonB-dependent SusC/RagA subfamily outer membrane receptor
MLLTKRQRLPKLTVSIGIALCFVFLWTVPASAQHEVEGQVVVAETGEPLPGANVVVAGTTIGTATNQEGGFSLEIPSPEDTLIVSLVGFREEVVPVEGRSSILIELQEEVRELEQVVVTGTGGATRRREIGANMSTIESADFEDLAYGNVEELLRGADAGITGISTSGQVGASGTIRLRGVTSVTQGNDPLIMIDGIRITNKRIPAASLEDGRGAEQSLNPLDLISMEDIESIEVVKGAAAATIYGTEASAGVIQLFTRDGQEGKTRGHFSSSLGANMWPQIGDAVEMHPTDLDIDQARRRGFTQKYNLSVSGGTSTLDYYLSTQVGDEEGIVRTQNAQNWSIRGNFDITLTENVTITLNNILRNQEVRYVGDGNNRHGYILNTMRLDKDYQPGTRDNDWVLTQELTSDQNFLVSSVSLDALVGDVNNSINLGVNRIGATNRGELPFGYPLNTEGTLGVQKVDYKMLSFEYIGRWAEDFGKNFASTLSWGGQAFDEYENSVDAGGSGFSGPGNQTLTSLSSTTATQNELREVNAGFFLQERIGWRDHTFVTVGIRADGSSTFGEDYGFQLYPKVSLSSVISEAAASWPSFWDQLRLRFAFGVAGRAPGAFDAVRTWSPVAGLNGNPGVTPSNLGDPNLGPERTQEIEFGIDSRMFSDRFGLEFTYYIATTTDALFPVQPRPSQGFIEPQLRNVGTVRNQGVEISSDLTVIRSEPLDWSLKTNVTLTDDEVTDMGGAPPFGAGGLNQQIREGYSPPSFFGQKVTNPDEIAPPEFEQDRFLGQTSPWLTASLGTTIEIGDSWTLRALGELQRGGHVLNAVHALNSVRGYWPPCNQVIEEKGREGMTALMRSQCFSEFWSWENFVERNDFFKLRNLSLGYTIPNEWLPQYVDNMRFTIKGTNLITITDYSSLDPEVNDPDTYSYLSQNDYYSLPPSRSATFKLNITF